MSTAFELIARHINLRRQEDELHRRVVDCRPPLHAFNLFACEQTYLNGKLNDVSFERKQVEAQLKELGVEVPS